MYKVSEWVYKAVTIQNERRRHLSSSIFQFSHLLHLRTRIRVGGYDGVSHFRAGHLLADLAGAVPISSQEGENQRD